MFSKIICPENYFHPQLVTIVSEEETVLSVVHLDPGDIDQGQGVAM